MNATASQTATALRQALELPGYVVLEPISRGASGVVYKAWDEARERPVALKLIERGLFDDEHTMRRFLREVRLQGGLEHPAILPLLDAGFLETHPYIVTELAAGGSLRWRLSQGGEPPLDFVWRTAASVARGLEHAHGLGVVHRDLKPENILLGARDEAKIADFGLATALMREQSRLTAPGTLLGTPSYIAPELIEGGEPTPPADVYSMGIVLFELLAGGPPFVGGDLMELLGEVLHGALPPLEMLRPDVAEPARALVLACLERDAARRPTAGAAAVSLERLMS